jgi:hypothetical protein
MCRTPPCPGVLISTEEAECVSGFTYTHITVIHVAVLRPVVRKHSISAERLTLYLNFCETLLKQTFIFWRQNEN